MDTRALVGRELLTPGAHLLEHVSALGIVGDPGDRRPCEHEMRLVRLRVLSEGAQHADGILEPVPPRHLADQGRALGDRPILNQVRPPAYAGLAPVEAVKQGAARVSLASYPDGGHNRID